MHVITIQVDVAKMAHGWQNTLALNTRTARHRKGHRQSRLCGPGPDRPAGQAEPADVDGFAGRPQRLEILSAVGLETERHVVAGDRTAHRVAVAEQQLPDRAADEVRPVRIEAFLDQQVDLAKVDEAEIDRQLLAVRRFRPKLLHIVRHPKNLHKPSGWMVYRWHAELKLQEPASWAAVPERAGATWLMPARQLSETSGGGAKGCRDGRSGNRRGKVGDRRFLSLS